MKCTKIVIMAVILAVLGVEYVYAQATATESVTIKATVNARAKLSFTTTIINFPDEDPDDTPIITSLDVPTVTAKVRTSGIPTLYCLATGDLISGGDSIGISNVTWEADAPFTDGTMSKTAPGARVDDGSWGSGTYTGSITYKLANSWSYKASATNYTTTVTYTLTAP